MKTRLVESFTKYLLYSAAAMRDTCIVNYFVRNRRARKSKNAALQSLYV